MVESNRYFFNSKSFVLNHFSLILLIYYWIFYFLNYLKFFWIIIVF